MRLKTFSAKSMKEVMAQVRAAMGPDAIIVSMEHGKAGEGVRVTAASDSQAAPPRETGLPPGDDLSGPAAPSHATPVAAAFDPADIKAAIAHHGIPYELADRILSAAMAFEGASVADSLAHAFEALIGFAPLSLSAPRPLMLVGPPGAGKTVSAAKLAAEAVMNGVSLTLITTDSVKAGGAQQLSHYAGLMEVKAKIAESPDTLAEAAGTPCRSELTVIDSCGINPFDIREIENLVALLKAVDAEPVLVLPAGGDPLEMADIGEVFAQMGARRFIATRLDTARRYGGVLTAARGGRLALAALCRSPYIAEHLESPGPVGLARLIAALPSGKLSQRVKERMS